MKLLTIKTDDGVKCAFNPMLIARIHSAHPDANPHYKDKIFIDSIGDGEDGGLVLKANYDETVKRWQELIK